MSAAASRLSTLLCVCLLSIASVAQTVVHNLISKPVDESQLTTLKGNTHPLARAENDQGAAPLELPMNRMLLVLKRSDEQETGLRTLLDNQQDKASSNYHKWLTPEDFGKQFGPSDQDIQQVTSWLQSHGFQIAQVSKGRTVIEFSGTAAQVQEALHTSIHKYVVNGEEHWANAGDPKIPSALTPVLAGVLTLHNFLKKPNVEITDQRVFAKYVPGAKPTFTSGNGSHALTPGDYGVIYNFNQQPGGGSGAAIAIVGRSNIRAQDVSDFHSLMSDGAPGVRVVVNGPDPGDLGGGDEVEAVLDSTWSGALAPGALVTLVVSASTNSTDGVVLSELYIINNNLADVMSESFGGCEADSNPVFASAVASWAQQAAAQGITYMVSTGDSGAAGCDDPNTEKVATGPLSVNILASTPYTVAVGGTMFNENGQNSTYWKSTNSTDFESAISYIPEDVWNESCSSANCASATPNILAGAGGASGFFQKPAWQKGFGDTVRDLPDVSLTAAEHDPYLICLAGSCTPDSQGSFYFEGVAGTSAAAPSFAGIMAQVDQKTGSRQGQADYVLYRLASVEAFSQCNGSKPGGLVGTCVFNDVTVGNNSVPGDFDYGSASAKYQSSNGYDLATGLGSVNVSNLLTAWNTATFNATTTTASISPLNAIHGDPINVNINVTANSGKPSGSVWLVGNNSPGGILGDNTSDIFTLDSSGSVVNTITHLIAGGNYSIRAHYIGDGTYGASDSSPVTVNIQPEASSTNISLFTTDSNGNPIPYTGGPYGTPVSIKAHVVGQSGYGSPTNSVTFWDNSQEYGSGNVDQNGDATFEAISSFTPGPYSFTGKYSGDASFKPSNSAGISIVVTQASTKTSLSLSPGTQGGTLIAIVGAGGDGNPPTGSITFYSGNASLGNATVSQLSGPNGTLIYGANLAQPQLPNGQYSFLATYSGDSNYLTSSSPQLNGSLQPDFGLSELSNSLTISSPGQSGDVGFLLNYYDGFSGTITFSCTGLPKEATCSAPTASAGNGTSGGVTVTVATMAPAKSLRAGVSGWVLWTATVGMGFAGIFLLGSRPSFRSSQTLLSLILITVLTFGIGCGGGSAPVTTAANGGSSSGGGSGPSDPGTPLGTYTVTVAATSGSISHSATFQLTVQ